MADRPQVRVDLDTGLVWVRDMPDVDMCWIGPHGEVLSDAEADCHDGLVDAVVLTETDAQELWDAWLDTSRWGTASVHRARAAIRRLLDGRNQPAGDQP